MSIGVYPGSFDPITYGHIDIIKRASAITDKLIVAVLNNVEKKSLFTVEERMDMIKEAVKNFNNIEVDCFDGLTVDYCMQKNATVMIRGLRAVTDFEYELQLAQINRELNPKVDTMFLFTNIECSYISSSAVKQVASFNGNIDKFVPPYVTTKVLEKYNLI